MISSSTPGNEALNREANTPRIVVITGAASGIGRATALRFAQAGHVVIALDRSEQALKALSEESEVAATLHPCVFDLADTSAITGLVGGLVQTHQRIDVLVNNAAVWSSQPLIDITDEAWELSLKINVTAPMALMRAAARHMIRNGGGSIVNIASRNAFVSSVENTAYDTSKAALVAMTRTAAGELAVHNIRVNAVCPGVIATPPNRELVDDDRFSSNYRRLIPMDRFGLAEEIANVVWFLAGDGASFVTGQTIVADGGQLACQNWKRWFQMDEESAG